MSLNICFVNNSEGRKDSIRWTMKGISATYIYIGSAYKKNANIKIVSQQTYVDIYIYKCEVILS